MEQISVFDMLKVGIGPSSSHTMGPWKAALQFVSSLQDHQAIQNVISIKVDLYGSLALTGKGHGTDLAIVLGLSGFLPETIPLEQVRQAYQEIVGNKELNLGASAKVRFNPDTDISFHFNQVLDFHANGMRIQAVDPTNALLLSKTYYSIGGGFVIEEGESPSKELRQLPHPIQSAKDLKSLCYENNQKIAEIVWDNEQAWRSEETIKKSLLEIWQVMLEGVYRGCHQEGILPGGLNVVRRAPALYAKLLKDGKKTETPKEWLEQLKSEGRDFEKTLKWVSCFAIATNEENASYGRVVTAPTNGSAGVIPAVLLYYICFSQKSSVSNQDIIDFLITASEIGCIFKKGSTISAAMGGCQAEIGVSSAMAAAALTEGLGGTPEQALMAAEIAMEHHLGLTCDPISGLVQIPCIERNSMGAIKAITASQIALESNPDLAKVSLDQVIKTMWETACDMNTKYKETSLGGLATNISVTVSEC